MALGGSLCTPPELSNMIPILRLQLSLNFNIFFSFPMKSFKLIFYALQFFFFKSLRGQKNNFTSIVKPSSIQLIGSPLLSDPTKTEGKHI